MGFVWTQSNTESVSSTIGAFFVDIGAAIIVENMRNPTALEEALKRTPSLRSILVEFGVWFSPWIFASHCLWKCKQEKTQTTQDS